MVALVHPICPPGTFKSPPVENPDSKKVLSSSQKPCFFKHKTDQVTCSSLISFVLLATGSRSTTPSPSKAPISREQALLESFFHTLSQFAFDRAKDQVVSYFLNYHRLHLPVNELTHKTCFQMTSNVCVSGVKL